jgi:type III pantothenate kinase
MAFIAVDIGNTSIKLGCYAELSSAGDVAPLQILKISTRDPESWQALEQLPAERADWCVGSVHRGAQGQLAKWVAHHRPADTYRRLQYTDLPLVMDVEFPERVGLDRLLAAVAVDHLRDSQRPAIAIDAGTAITLDLVSASGVFQGGVIWPGWQMMAESLAGKTDALPLLTAPVFDAPPPIIGKSTEKAMHSALFWGNVGAVREFVARIQAELPSPAQVFVTGGDAQRLAAIACPEAQRVSELVLSGIVLAAQASPS